MLEITNLTKTKIDRASLQKAARAASAFLRRNKNEISVVFVSEKRIREINKKYRAKNAPTDVLSFEGLNEVFICPLQAKKQAHLLKTSLNTELTRLLVHGIVHLKGYDHERSKSAELEMQKIENEILKRIRNKDLRYKNS